jgi:hypothetical protein
MAMTDPTLGALSFDYAVETLNVVA